MAQLAQGAPRLPGRASAQIRSFSLPCASDGLLLLLLWLPLLWLVLLLFLLLLLLLL